MEIFILDLLILSVNCDETKSKCKLSGIIRDANNRDVTNVKEACKSKPCVTKCCDIDHYFHFNKSSRALKCLHKDDFQLYMNVSQVKFDFSEYIIYKTSTERTDKDFLKDYVVLVNKDFQFKECRYKIRESLMFEDGRLGYDTPDNHTNFKNQTEYCVDKFIFKTNKTKNGTKVKFMAFELIDTEDKESFKLIFIGVALMISAFFMILILLVYIVLKKLRNIQGLILMGYIATFFIAYVLKAATILGLAYGKIRTIECKYLTPFSYGFILSFFFWMNVMSFDIWWTFRATIKIRSIHRQGVLMKFMWYGFYAWGAPAVITIAAYFIDSANQLNLIKPQFEKCFQTDEETKLYLYLPILIITVINTLLLLMTIYNLWLIKRVMSNFDAPTQGNIKMNRNRFCLYIKVSVITGATWILELAQFPFNYTNQLPTWSYILLNIPNMFIGVLIFFVFVFKKSIYTQLCKKCKITNKSLSTGRNTDNSEGGKRKTKSTDLI